MATARRDSPSDGAKLRVLRRDGYKCTYCEKSGSDHELEIDHIIPVSKGGSHHIANLTTACRGCNQSKSNKLDFKKPDRKTGITVSNSIVGFFVHTLEDKELVNQGQIVSYIDSIDSFAVRRFSFLDGRPTDVIFIKTEDIANPLKSKIYESPIELHRHYCGWQKKGTLVSFIDPENETYLESQFPEYY